MSEQTCEQPRPARLGRAPLIAIRQSVRRPSGEHTSSVCVASPGGVALWEDQHVLAQCGQMVPAQRAAVRGGLQVLSRAHSPPARVRLALVAHAYIRSPPPCSRSGMHRQAGLPKIPSERSRKRLRKHDEGRQLPLSRPLAVHGWLGRKKALSARQNDGFETLASTFPPSRKILRRRPVVEHLVAHSVTAAHGVPNRPCDGAVRHVPLLSHGGRAVTILPQAGAETLRKVRRTPVSCPPVPQGPECGWG